LAVLNKTVDESWKHIYAFLEHLQIKAKTCPIDACAMLVKWNSYAARLIMRHITDDYTAET
jgi:hypothetical protein